MTLDDYKELMRFHILLSDIDLSGQHYAAVDSDGGLHTYGLRPSCSVGRSDNGFYIWTPIEEVDDTMSADSNFRVIAILPLPEDSTKTLITL